MLVLTRKVGERIHIGDNIVLTVVRIQSDKVRIGIEAPASVTIHREEVYQRIEAVRASDVHHDGDLAPVSPRELLANYGRPAPIQAKIPPEA